MTTEPNRYHRQQLLSPIGLDGQAKLRRSRALLVGCGALGTVIADLLTRAGVGELIVVDRDVVELTNLQRQVLFDEADAEADLPKAEAAAIKLRAINREVKVRPVVADFAPSNAPQLAAGVDVLLDGTDNFETRYLLNDLSVKLAVPYVYGGAVATSGTLMTVLPAADEAPWGEPTPCLRCLFPEVPSQRGMTCDTVGVLASVSATVAAAQVTEAIKVLLGDWQAVDRRLRSFDAWSNSWQAVDVTRSRATDCECCGLRTFECLDGGAFSQVVSLCGRNAVQVKPSGGPVSADFEALAESLHAHGSVAVNDYTLKVDLTHAGDDLHITLFADGRAIVQGTDDPAVARAVCSKYIGL